MSSYFPAAVRRLILSALEDKARPAYGQAATVDGRGRAQVRTVHFRYIKEKGTLGFGTHVKSPKWGHLRRRGACSGCYHDHHRLVQLRWEGPVRLVDPRTSSKADRAVLERMWLLMRPQVRAAYWKDSGAKSFDVGRRCPNMGLVLCRPVLWDVFILHPKDYTLGRRIRYELKGTAWRARRVSLLHGEKL